MPHTIIGHENIIEQLHHAIQSDRIAGAYLFVGPASVGKETVAWHFAKSINCLESGVAACGKCLSCRKTEDGNHPDMQIIRPSGAWMKIDQVRELQKQIVYRPLEGQRKVYILTDAERMNLEAANCLLKTLEEPPAASVLILIITNLEALLPTIRSRCQIIRFQPMQVPELAAYLTQEFDLEAPQAVSIATLSDGAVGRALGMVQKEGANDQKIPDILTAANRLEVFQIAEQFSENPDALDGLITWYRDLLLLHQNAPTELLTHGYHADALKPLIPHYSRRRLQAAIQTVLETKNLLLRNVNSTLALEVMTLKLIG